MSIDRCHVSDFRTQIGLAVQRQRRRRHLTQEQLAEAANLSTRHIADIEAGTKNFTMKTLDKIARALQWDPLAELTKNGGPLSEKAVREAAAHLHDLRPELEATLARLKTLHDQFIGSERPKKAR
jgi:transcriptional regulator with XRE-family HTH domain